MKASTLFGLTFALLMGLGVVVAARVAGFFEPKTVVIDSKKETNGFPMLIANRNMMRGTTPIGADAKVRPMTEQDHAMYDKYREKMLAPIPSAVELRVLKDNVRAGTPLMEDMFEPLALHEQISNNLAPNMRAVTLLLEKHRVASGLPRVGEFVDVLLTATIRQTAFSKDTAPMAPFTASAIIARRLKIIGKRDSLFQLNIPNPANQPLSYMLEANPYRSALIEFAKTRGYLTLELVAPANLTNGPEPMVDVDSREYRDEDKRVREFINNEHTITDADLERIFNIRTRPDSDSARRRPGARDVHRPAGVHTVAYRLRLEEREPAKGRSQRIAGASSGPAGGPDVLLVRPDRRQGPRVRCDRLRRDRREEMRDVRQALIRV